MKYKSNIMEERKSTRVLYKEYVEKQNRARKRTLRKMQSKYSSLLVPYRKVPSIARINKLQTPFV